MGFWTNSVRPPLSIRGIEVQRGKGNGFRSLARAGPLLCDLGGYDGCAVRFILVSISSCCSLDDSASISTNFDSQRVFAFTSLMGLGNYLGVGWKFRILLLCLGHTELQVRCLHYRLQPTGSENISTVGLRMRKNISLQSDH